MDAVACPVRDEESGYSERRDLFLGANSADGTLDSVLEVVEWVKVVGIE